MLNSSVAQPAVTVQDGDALIQIAFDRVYDRDRLVIRQSRNDGESYQTAVVIPLADALAFAKALLDSLTPAVSDGLRPAESDEEAQMNRDLDAILARDAEEDEWIDRMWEREQARRSVMAGLDGDIEDDYEFIRRGC